MFGQMSDAFVCHKETWQQMRKMFHYKILRLAAEPKVPGL